MITPSHVHIHLEVSLRARVLLISTFEDPGVQGTGVTGIQGIGVNTPKAAAVAVATAGLAREAHMPNDGILIRGT